MKLYRYEVYSTYKSKYEGIVKSIERHNPLSTMVKKNERQSNVYEKEFIRKLRSPTKRGFINKEFPPIDALFFFTQKGSDRFGKYMRLIESYYRLCGYTTRLVVIDVNKSEIEIYYRDVNQICIRVK